MTLLLLLMLQEETARSYIEGRRELENLSIFGEMERAVLKLEAPYLTDGLALRKKQRLEKRLKMAPRTRGHRIEDVVVDGGTVLVTETWERALHDPTTGRDSIRKMKRKSKFAMKETEAGWIITESHRECLSCEGSGKCRYGEEESCPACKGKKTCPRCEGKKWSQDKFGNLEVQLLIADADYQPTEDRSTPEKSAESFSHLMVRLELKMSAQLRRYLEKHLDLMKKHYEPKIADSLRKQYDVSVEKGKGRFAGFKPEVKSFTKTKDTAGALIPSPPSWLGTGTTVKSVVFVLSGGEWKAGKVMESCWRCRGKKKDCVLCGRSGFFEEP